MEFVSLNIIIDLALLILLVVTAFAVILSTNLLAGTIFLAIYSLLMAAMYLVLGAPDVAITEAAIGGGISTLLVLAVLLLTGEKEKMIKHKAPTIVVIFITSGALIYATMGMPAFGDVNAAPNSHLVPYYLGISGEEIGIPNVVTSILASYRGFDTLGETFVIFTAAISILLLLGGKSRKSQVK